MTFTEMEPASAYEHFWNKKPRYFIPMQKFCGTYYVFDEAVANY